MECEYKIVLDATVDTETRKQTRQSVNSSSKLTRALLAFILCLTALAATAVLLLNQHTKVEHQFLTSL